MSMPRPQRRPPSASSPPPRHPAPPPGRAPLHRRPRRSAALPALSALLLSLGAARGSGETTVIVVNRGSGKARVLSSSAPEAAEVAALEPGAAWSGAWTPSGAARGSRVLTLDIAGVGLTELSVPRGSWAAAVVGGDVADGDAPPPAAVHDTNGVQLELSRAAHACLSSPASSRNACSAAETFGGIPVDVFEAAFLRLWGEYRFWSLCEADEPSPVLRTITLASGHVAEVVRESPLVAAVQGFLNASTCEGLMGAFGKESLTRAHVGSGGGNTDTSESRETLTKNLFVDWDKDDDLLTRTAVRSFDVASELFGEPIPYEGQEPVNFLHYLRGFEYRPHMDGRAESTGKRVATTLIYCEAATKGGATIFPVAGSQSVRFVPGDGDMLFFKYKPRPSDTLHAACPVSEGLKSTLTQWYRLGVSPENPWDKYEDWGHFHNPYGTSRWKGDRYSSRLPRAEEL